MSLPGPISSDISGRFLGGAEAATGSDSSEPGALASHDLGAVRTHLALFREGGVPTLPALHFVLCIVPWGLVSKWWTRAWRDTAVGLTFPRVLEQRRCCRVQGR